MVIDGVLATTNGLSEKAFSDLEYGVGLWHETKEIQQSITLLEQHVQYLFDAVKDGSLVQIQFLVESHGLDVLSCTDNEGHTAAHWACLRGHKDVLRYIIDLNGPINEPSGDQIGQRPIHWACVQGHTALIAMLLKHGVSIEVTDNKGCTPLIVASQHGQTLLAGYLIGMGASQYSFDKEGDTALHWAAFKGHDELMRLLIYMGCNPSQTDNFLQTPLHLACISGHLSIVRGLCEQEYFLNKFIRPSYFDNVEINPADKNGKTPNMLAAGRKHVKVVEYLKKLAKQRRRIFSHVDFWSVIFGPSGNTKAPLLFIIVLLICWAYPMYIIKCIPLTWDDLQLVHVVFIGINVTMWFSLYAASTSNPGYLPRNILQYDLVLQQVTIGDSWNRATNPLSRLCHTCRTVKPLRSKHCRWCNRCVAVFDHHCPFIYNCVGLGNRVWFATFIASIFLMCIIGCFFCWYMLNVEYDLIVLLGLFKLTFVLVLSLGLLAYSVYHAAVNLTTNEHINFKRYSYLQDSNGRFQNPFDRGFRRNLMEFIHLHQPLIEDETGTLNMTIV